MQNETKGFNAKAAFAEMILEKGAQLYKVSKGMDDLFNIYVWKSNEGWVLKGFMQAANINAFVKDNNEKMFQRIK